MTQQGYRYRQIRDVLQVSVGLIAKSNQRYEAEGVDGLKSKYWGTQGFLSREHKQALMAWLGSRDHWTIEEVMNHIEAEYGVIYQYRQSYYTLLQEAGFSWKKSQPTHPDKDNDRVSEKKNEILALLSQWRAEIASGQVRVLFLDECHLVWSDISGYGWSRRNQRVDVPIASLRDRQTYYGALDYLTKRFVVQEYNAGNEDNTVSLKYLQLLYDNSTRLIILWDGVSYHRSAVVREFLAQVNAGLPQDQWNITCVRLAPRAPEQNPVEEVWLQAKQFVRKYARLCHRFWAVKLLFNLATHCQPFTFAKAFMYGYCSCPI